MTVRNPYPPNEIPPLEDIFTARVVDGRGTSFFEPPGPPEVSCSSRDLERGSDKEDKEDKDDTLSTRSTTTTSIANTTTTSSLRDLGTPSVLLPANFQEDPLYIYFRFLFGGHFKRNRMFFDEGNGVVHIKVPFGEELPQKPEELATLDDYLWNHLSANYRVFSADYLKYTGSHWEGFCASLIVVRFLFSWISCVLSASEKIPPYFLIYFGRILIFVDLILATWWRKIVKSQAILNNHMVDNLKARFLAHGYNLDCYRYYSYEEDADSTTRLTNLCFVIYPTTLNAQAFVRYKGDILLGEGFGTAHIHINDFPKEKPKNLVTLDDDIWNDYAAKMIRPWFVNMSEAEGYFALNFLTAMVWYTLIACYGWSANIGDSGTTLSKIIFSGTIFLVLMPSFFARYVLAGIFFLQLLLKMILGIFRLIVACIGVKFWGSKNIREDFTGRFQENGYKIEIVEEHGLVVFIPMLFLSGDYDTNMETV